MLRPPTRAMTFVSYRLRTGRFGVSIEKGRLHDGSCSSPHSRQFAVKDASLETLATLLSVLRGYSVLKEVRPTAFHLEGRDFIHFHEEPNGIFADVLLARGRVRMPVSSAADQAELLGRIEEKLSSLESHGAGKSEKRRGRRDRDQ